MRISAVTSCTGPKAQTLRDIRRVCSLGPLNRDELSRYWVETDAGRDPERSVRKAIRTRLDDCLEGEDMHALVYGHGGCGKSTELTKLVENLGEGFLAVTFSIRSPTDSDGSRVTRGRTGERNRTVVWRWPVRKIKRRERC